MHRALLALEPVRGIRVAALALGVHQLALAGNDDEEHVGDHDRAEHGAEVHVRAAAAEELAQPQATMTSSTNITTPRALSFLPKRDLHMKS